MAEKKPQNEITNPFGLSYQQNGEHPQKNIKIDPALIKTNEKLSDISRSLRMLEERYDTLRKKNQMSDQNLIDDTSKIFTKIKIVFEDINSIKLDMEEMKQKLDTFGIEIKEMANSHDLKILQKYVDMWEPMKFLTEKEALRIIRDELNNKEE